MDSCENAFDAPLTYEKGWGKQLTYIVAVSTKDISDVTYRYVLDKKMNRMRRGLVNEGWLAQFLENHREQLWEMQGPELKAILMERYYKEQFELEELDNNKVVVDELLPR